MSAAIDQLGQNQLAGFVLVLSRVGPLFMLAPPFNSKMVPVRARAIVAVGFAVGLAPIALHGQTVPGDALQIAGLALKEVLVGLGFAFALACLFAAFATAGTILDTSMGFSFGSLIDPVTNVQSGQMVQVYSMVAIAVFIAIGGDAWVIEGLARSYEVVPVLEMPSLTALVAGAAGEFAAILGAALEVAAPVLLALILTDVAFGVVSRVVPQLNVFAVGFPIKIGVGLLVVGVSLPFVGGWLSGQLQLSVESALGSLRLG
ncbi:MAG TPA: flagellar biosynthetic protein FliR [Solirubrobacterales bacterium]|nr:flagellar biosynthetic protein FliR [Solirubrobacterales bacterium]